ncbi:peptidase S8/S53 domain-containing protein [Hygrophoropsis aurantiaca]|uniref:Peptidase S8/S53 domain-containing protein n=1 Tax=Hygrophoropsis aurantiaca TaxID=72124 RepID=A0ACB8A885_9AGAM|nr:peptidase S8/S53 domain-containing protein [Hygrophoropsis aurantiaca]
MRPSFVAVVYLALALGAYASPSPWVVHERRTSIPTGWSHARKLPSSATVPLRFGLTQGNIEDIEKHLLDVSHPDSPNYGNHWTAEQVAATFAPRPESIDAVYAWLMGSGVGPERIKMSPSGSWVEVTSNIQEAENLLNTNYHVYAHESGKEHLACDHYHLPAHVAPHVDFVTPTIHFDAVLSKREIPGDIGLAGDSAFGPKTTGETIPDTSFTNDLKDCHTTITPDCLKALYNIKYTPVAGSKNSFAVVQYTPAGFLQSDLDMFAKKFNTGWAGKPPKLVSIDGGVVQTTNRSFEYDSEASVDIEYSSALLTTKQNVTVYQVGDLVEGASFNNFLDALDASYCKFAGGDDSNYDAIYPDTAKGGYTGKAQCGAYKPANVISSSYGYNEADLSAKYAARQCLEYGKLGLMGVTFVSGTGDSGVEGNRGMCLDSKGAQVANGTRFNPTFPGTCPFVTAVGATQIKAGGSVTDPEIACKDHIQSGGGFSNYFKVPAYQKSAVSAYLKSHAPKYPAGTYNITGRAYPDLAANGAHYAVAVVGKFTPTYGTSASAPVMAAMLALVNDARIAKGKKPIGFINPTLYSSKFAKSFHDIKSGNNPGCGTNGFSAAAGWDPVTGLGTVNLGSLITEWLTLA